MSDEGLREAKKRQTREAISGAATRLFLDRGYENVTIADIAAAANVAKMTVTNYFPRKEDLALDRAEELIAGIVDPVRTRSVGESVIAASRRGYADRLRRRDASLGLSGPSWVTMVYGSPALRSRLREIYEQAEDALAGEIANGEPGIHDRMVAAQVTAANRVLLHVALRASLAGRPRDEIIADLHQRADEAFNTLEPTGP